MEHVYSIQGADKSPGAISHQSGSQRGNSLPAVPVIQHKQFADGEQADQLKEQSIANNTGLPDNLKSGVEGLSGIAMDDVKVHYNSDKPAGLQAYAYAQGTDIHIGPGQEQHLPHEAWHVVQQKQGRVKPTIQLKVGTPVNDDTGLEQEADHMGAKALTAFTMNDKPLQQKKLDSAVVQGVFLNIESGNFQNYVSEQERKQNAIKTNAKVNDDIFTTVGFEHEFTQTVDNNKLEGISHLELAKAKKLPYTGLPFILETDAANALELVSPPFLVKTLPGSMIPDPTDIEKIDGMMKTKLAELAGTGTIGNLIEGFRAIGIDFSAAKDLKIEAKNVSHKSAAKNYSEEANSKLDLESLKDIAIKLSEKGGGITSQVNFATDASTFDHLREMNKQEPLIEKEGSGYNPKAILATLEQRIIAAAISATDVRPTANLNIFINHLGRTLSAQFAVPALDTVKKTQDEIYNGANLTKEVKGDEDKNRENKAKLARFRFSANLSSLVKDVHGVWIKDSLMNIGLGILDTGEWQEVRKIMQSEQFKTGIKGLALLAFTNINGFEDDLPAGNKLIAETLELAKLEMLIALDLIIEQIALIESNDLPAKELAIVPTEPVGFMGHNKEMIAPRQDTFIDPRNAQIQGVGQRLHVVETRKDGIDMFYKLGLQSKKLGPDGLAGFQKRLLVEIHAIEEEIKKIEEDWRVRKADLLKTIQDFEGELGGLVFDPGEYDNAISAFKISYAKDNPGKEAGKSTLKTFEKKCDLSKENIRKRQDSLRRQLVARRKDLFSEINVDKTIEKKREEIKSYLPELREIETQLKDLAGKK